MHEKGYLISFEGGEGAGKTEQTHRLLHKIRDTGHEVISLREPGGTQVSEQIREVVLSAKNHNITDFTEVLLFQAARAQIYGEIVIPALEAKKVVIMDRTRDSSVVYQGIVRGMGISFIERLNKISTHNHFPDLTFLLDVPAEVGIHRMAQVKKMDRIDSENIDFHHQVRQGYLRLADRNDRGRWFVIDAQQELDQVSQEIWHIVSMKLQINK